MFIVVFWMNRNLKDSWLMMGLEVIVGVVIYGILVLILKAPIVYEARDLIVNKLKNRWVIFLYRVVI